MTLAALVVLVIAGGLAYLFLALPRTAAPSSFQARRTPELLARGEYLSRHVTGCTVCHGQRDWTKFSAPAIPARMGHGGNKFDLGDAGTLYAPNLTPAALSTWTDGEILRAMTEGVSKDGTPLFPLMPYENFRQMTREDAEAIIAFIRTLPPTQQAVPPRALKFPLTLIVRTIPQPATLPETRPDPATDLVGYGRYLTTIASCTDCHTPMDNGQRRPGMEFAGGTEFRLPTGGVQRSANITPDVQTGIGSWTERQFLDRFAQAASMDDAASAMNGRQNTEMPWRDYSGMKQEDLAAIYAYLRTVPAVRNAVPR